MVMDILSTNKDVCYTVHLIGEKVYDSGIVSRRGMQGPAPVVVRVPLIHPNQLTFIN